MVKSDELRNPRGFAIRRGMRWFCLVSASVLAACGATEVQSQKLQDGSYNVTCELSMDECIRRVQDRCRNQRFRILEGTSEVRLRDAPPFERAYHTSRLHFECTDDSGKPLISLDAAAAARSADPAKSAPAARSCVSGETRVCVGAGACKGGQACLTDGSGFGPCDCGPVAPVPASDVAPPAGATAPPNPTP